ncbi:MAG: hypothetical protein JNJ73_02245 [Hyphomonadaceae bacterium]|nr:hypothetical protein [Hyphomonadaceae bacterium]
MSGPSSVTISFLLEPDQLDDAGGWAEWVATQAAEIDPALMRVEGYRIVDGTVIIAMRAEERADKLSKRMEKLDGMRRFRTTLADHGVKANVSVGDLETEIDYQIVQTPPRSLSSED